MLSRNNFGSNECSNCILSSRLEKNNRNYIFEFAFSNKDD